MPDSLPRMRYWLRAVRYAHEIAGSDFAAWTARHALQLPGNQNGAFLSDLGDWVQASRANRDSLQFVVRPFSPDMSLRTVTNLSAEWHEAIAARLDGPQHAFLSPWIAACKIDGLDIIPIDNSADLYREGTLMHHCIGTYVHDVIGGRCYVYSIRRDGERIATAALIRKQGHSVLAQIRGPCNIEPSGEIKRTVQRWLRSAGREAEGTP
jgi:hypothetical protein